MKVLITIAVVIVALGGGYFWFISRSDEPVDTLFAAEVREKLESYQKIHELSPNLSIFDDALFQALRAVERIPASATSSVRAGRDNPFTPF
ncbi:MAG: hypothetical protein HY471_02000 [Candidatus Sungbacteria bacterium]|nr:hypothetical protein [Candidatus Sungbacteria bacterium]